MGPREISTAAGSQNKNDEEDDDHCSEHGDMVKAEAMTMVMTIQDDDGDDGRGDDEDGGQ